VTASDAAAAGRDVAQLRVRLSSLLAAAEDLAEEWEATLELAEHLRTQRRTAGQDASTAAVLTDLEALMRASAAFPTAGHRCRTLAELQPAIVKAERAYERLLRQHLDHARHHLDTHTGQHRDQ
jgi:hypothetical protein